MLGGHRGHCGHTVDYAFRSRSQGYPGLSDENGTVMTGEEMRSILQSLGISVAWSEILVTSGTKRRNKQGPEGRNSGERRVQRPRWL
jgi:hypothetical protein